ncbi:MAG: 30S ribosomal protein S9 [Candidatus Diapherotrites archaeon ADurb.Bin253]|jgi:small subunit ribosomal protein S9|nr:30S ribosomal protein S9 [Candidatus Pacearchaeota archaeon]OQA69087.1 MAG: 30S ribosomal protein S9 [Candidatus Diapherotrites archaeon ADurb.Bin253]HNZ52152.1 30S ribosomal protein S9 [Candidatus Pacearchaeota archaeon]HOC97171.1 30S ribosomal protein S9 [Candidatus Pacearchaeota archaeon]HOF44158.1 30S ribosomal protein S9 [Candidatus Pacearchaeota archaeon]
MSKIITSGKRKTAIAKAEIKEGNGKITINKIDYRNLHKFDFLRIKEPLMITEKVLGKLNFDVKITVVGGGEKGQVEAARLALSRAIVKFTGSTELEDAFFDYDRNLLVADVRRKEANKPGDSKARSKRQTSYR